MKLKSSVLLLVSGVVFAFSPLDLTTASAQNLTLKDNSISSADQEDDEVMFDNYEDAIAGESITPNEPLEVSDDAEQIESDVREAMMEHKAVLEISKYPVKDTDVMSGSKVTDDNLNTVFYLDDALSARRLIGYGGILKEIHKELNLGDAEDGDLVKIEEEDDEVANEAFEVMAYWHPGIKNYIIK